jgi:hypothetical protein
MERAQTFQPQGTLGNTGYNFSTTEDSEGTEIRLGMGGVGHHQHEEQREIDYGRLQDVSGAHF